jgi:hypothetical protein
MIKIQCRKNTFFSTPIVEMIKYFLQSVFLQLTVNFILGAFRRGGEQIIHPFARRPDGLRKNAPAPASLPSPSALWAASRTVQPNKPPPTSSLATRTTRKSKDNRPTCHPQAKAETTSNCTIPFGHPSQPETTRFSETHNITLTRRADRPNGNWNSQELEVTDANISQGQEVTKHTQLRGHCWLH